MEAFLCFQRALCFFQQSLIARKTESYMESLDFHTMRVTFKPSDRVMSTVFCSCGFLSKHTFSLTLALSFAGSPKHLITPLSRPLLPLPLQPSAATIPFSTRSCSVIFLSACAAISKLIDIAHSEFTLAFARAIFCCALTSLYLT